MIQEEIHELKQKIAVTTKANRHFIFDKPTVPGEEVPRSITLTTTRVFESQQYLTPLTSAEYSNINHAD